MDIKIRMIEEGLWGDGGLFLRTLEAINVDGETVAFLGRLKRQQDVPSVPQEEVHFFDKEMSRTGSVSFLDNQTGILSLLDKGGNVIDTQNVHPDVIKESVAYCACVLAEKPGVSIEGMLFGVTIIEMGHINSYRDATVDQLNSSMPIAKSPLDNLGYRASRVLPDQHTP